MGFQSIGYFIVIESRFTIQCGEVENPYKPKDPSATLRMTFAYINYASWINAISLKLELELINSL